MSNRRIEFCESRRRYQFVTRMCTIVRSSVPFARHYDNPRSILPLALCSGVFAMTMARMKRVQADSSRVSSEIGSAGLDVTGTKSSATIRRDGRARYIP